MLQAGIPEFDAQLGALERQGTVGFGGLGFRVLSYP